MSLSRGNFLSLLAAFGAAAVPKEARPAQPPWYPLPPPKAPGTGRALVLSGGGARGSYEAGALKWLFRDVDRQGPPFDVVCGTSAGAINAAFAAAGTYASIQRNGEFWRTIPSANVTQFIPQVEDGITAAALYEESGKHGYPAKLGYLFKAQKQVKQIGPVNHLGKIMGVIDSAGVHSLIQKYQLSFDQLRTNLIVTATNVTDIAAVAFYNFVEPNAASQQEAFLKQVRLPKRFARETSVPPLTSFTTRYHPLTSENLIQAVVASTAVPGAFAPVWIHREDTNTRNLYVDGGVANNTPINLAVAAGATDITIVMVTSPHETVPKPPQNLFELISACYTLMHSKILENDITLAFGRNILARNKHYSGLNATSRAFLDSLEEQNWRPITLRVIRPRDPLQLSILGFNDQQGIDAALDLGYADAQAPYVYSMG